MAESALSYSRSLTTAEPHSAEDSRGGEANKDRVFITRVVFFFFPTEHKPNPTSVKEPLCIHIELSL